MTDSTSPHHPEFSQIEATIKEVAEMNVTQNTLDGVTSRVLQTLHVTTHARPAQNASTTQRRAIIAIALASLSVIAAIFIGSVPSSSVAFAQTQKQVEKTQTVQYVEYIPEAVARHEISKHKSRLKDMDTELALIAKDKDRSADKIVARQSQIDSVKLETNKSISQLEAALQSGKPIEHQKVYIRGRYLQRAEQDEASGKQIITISNAETGELVIRDPTAKTFTQQMKNFAAVAVLVKIGEKNLVQMKTPQEVKVGEKSVSMEIKPRPEANFDAGFAAIATEKLTPIPEKQLDGVTVLGFQDAEVKANFTAVRTFWINKSTQLPIRIDVVLTQEGIVIGGFSQSDFVFDAPLDDTLFSTEPPAGYTVRESVFISAGPAN